MPSIRAEDMLVTLRIPTLPETTLLFRIDPFRSVSWRPQAREIVLPILAEVLDGRSNRPGMTILIAEIARQAAQPLHLPGLSLAEGAVSVVPVGAPLRRSTDPLGGEGAPRIVFDIEAGRFIGDDGTNLDLEDIRAFMRLSQELIADLVDLDGRHLSNWNNVQACPDPTDLVALDPQGVDLAGLAACALPLDGDEVTSYRDAQGVVFAAASMTDVLCRGAGPLLRDLFYDRRLREALRTGVLEPRLTRTKVGIAFGPAAPFSRDLLGPDRRVLFTGIGAILAEVPIPLRDRLPGALKQAVAAESGPDGTTGAGASAHDAMILADAAHRLIALGSDVARSREPAQDAGSRTTAART